jgi:hypothetical protein
MKNRNSFMFWLFLILAGFGCKEKGTDPVVDSKRPFVNIQHLENLYHEVKMPNGTVAGSIVIYSDFPNYSWVADEDEGLTCVDDVARAALFYLNEPDLVSNVAK